MSAVGFNGGQHHPRGSADVLDDSVDEEAILAILTKDVEIRKKAEQLNPERLTQYVEGLESAHLAKETRSATIIANATGKSVATVTVPPKMYTYVSCTPQSLVCCVCRNFCPRRTA